MAILSVPTYRFMIHDENYIHYNNYTGDYIYSVWNIWL